MLDTFELDPYQRNLETEDKVKKTPNSIYKNLEWQVQQWLKGKSLLVFIIAFILGRAIIGEQIAPFGFAFLIANVIRNRALILPVILMVILGEKSRGVVEYFWLNPVSYLSLALFRNFLGRKTAGYFYLSLVAVSWIFLTKFVLLAIFTSPLSYDFIKIFVEALLAGALLPSFLIVLGVIQKPRENFGKLQEEMVSISLLVLGILLGINFSVGGYDLSVVFSKYLVMLAAFGGIGWGAAFGVVCGLLPGLAQFNGLLLTGLYSVSGLLAGSLRHWGKIGIIIGFFCGNSIYAFYFNDQIFLMNFLETSLFAAIMLLFTPNKLVINLYENWFRKNKKKKNLPVSIEDGMNDLKNLFQVLSAKYTETAAAVNQHEGDDSLLKNLINKVCRDCALYHLCWERDGNLYYKYLLEWLARIEQKGKEDPEELMPVELKSRCRKSEELAKSFSYLLALESANNFWRKKTANDMEAVSAQFKSTVKLLEKAQQDWERQPKRIEEIEETLLLELGGLYLFPDKLEVWGEKEQDLEINLDVKLPKQRKVNYTREIVKVFSETLKSPVIIKKEDLRGLGKLETLNLRLIVTREDKPKIGFAKMAREGSAISGDALLVSRLSKKRWLFLLSDGMGSGERAYQESSSLILLAEQLLLLDFPLEETIKMLNSLTFLNGDERFATIDLALLDENKGEIEFIKIGSTPSLLFAEDGYEIIEANSMPMGVMEKIMPESILLPYKKESVLVMVSDGIWQGSKIDYKEGWLTDFVKGIWRLEPQKLAYNILEHANILHGGKPEDDLTVLVVKID